MYQLKNGKGTPGKDVQMIPRNSNAYYAIKWESMGLYNNTVNNTLYQNTTVKNVVTLGISRRNGANISFTNVRSAKRLLKVNKISSNI